MLSSIRSLSVPTELLLKAKQDGFSDRQVGHALGTSEGEARALRLRQDIRPWVKQVRTSGHWGWEWAYSEPH